MNIKASGRSALIIAAGFWVWCQDRCKQLKTPKAASWHRKLKPPRGHPLR